MDSTFSKISTLNLLKQIILFSILNSPKLNDRVKRITTYLLKHKWPISWILEQTVFHHFCGGTSIKDCRRCIDKLSQNNVSTILDYSIESGNEFIYNLTVQELINTIFEAKNNSSISFTVFKFTSIADIDLLERMSKNSTLNEDLIKFERVKQRVDLLCKTAFDNNVKILIDAEHSWIQDIIDNVAESMMDKYNSENSIVYTTIQLYRNDRLKYLIRLHTELKSHGKKTALKLVRGAYMDMERERALIRGYTSPIYNTKKETDNDYNLSLKYCIENIDTMSICVGTHNSTSCEFLTNLIIEKKISFKDDRIFFAQLLGMADDISNNLASRGFNVAKYVPYGKVEDVLPYLFRRADENKSISGEMSRELLLRKMELSNRRKIIFK